MRNGVVCPFLSSCARFFLGLALGSSPLAVPVTAGDMVTPSCCTLSTFMQLHRPDAIDGMSRAYRCEQLAFALELMPVLLRIASAIALWNRNWLNHGWCDFICSGADLTFILG